MEPIQTRNSKIYQLDIDKEKSVWGKGYKEIVVCENDKNIWSYDDVECEFRVDLDGTLMIMSGDNWVYISKNMLPVLKEAIEVFEKNE